MKYKHRIYFEKKVTETNENNFELKIWVTEKTLWADVNNLYGKEFWAAKANNFEDVVIFIFRYSKFLESINKNDYRIKFKNKIFSLIFIDNVKYENKTIKIKAISNDLEGDINE